MRPTLLAGLLLLSACSSTHAVLAHAEDGFEPRDYLKTAWETLIAAELREALEERPWGPGAAPSK
jgi:hypothetical protein